MPDDPTAARRAKKQAALDRRLTTPCKDLEELLEVLDFDDLNDLEDFFQFLLGRPVRIEFVDRTEGGPDDLVVVVRCEVGGLGTGFPWPVTVEDLVRSSFGENHVHYGHFPEAIELAYDPLDLETMPPEALEAAFINAIGLTHIVRLLGNA